MLSETLLPPSNYVQVITVNGLFVKYRQPVYYDFDKNLTKDILYPILEEMHKIHFDIQSSIVEGIGCSPEKPFFRNPFSGGIIFVFADVPHLLKLIRNHFLDDGFIINGKVITKQPLIELLEKNKDKDLKIAPKLTSDHLTVKNASRQMVKRAAQLFSHTNSTALTRMGSTGMVGSENWLEFRSMIGLTYSTVEFLR